MGLSDAAALYLDSCIFIAGFETSGPIAASVRRLLKALATKPGVAVTSELTFAEVLAPTKRIVMTVAERTNIYVPLIDEGGFIRAIPVSRSILMRTTTLRQDHPQRLPDALHIATALEARCRFFMSSDRDANRLPDCLRRVTPTSPDIDLVLAAIDA